MDQRDLDGSPLEPGDLTGDDPSISETPRAGVGEANTSPEINVDPHEEKEGDESSKISRSALRRTPSLRSLVLLRCAQSPSFAALSPWLRHAAGFACGLFVFEAAGFACGKNTLTVELSDFPRRDD